MEPNLCNKNFKRDLRIGYYATTSGKDSVYIIGGYITEKGYRSSTIAEFKNDQWRNLGDLQQARYSHGAIKVGSLTYIIGGVSSDGSG